MVFDLFKQFKKRKKRGTGYSKQFEGMQRKATSYGTSFFNGKYKKNGIDIGNGTIPGAVTPCIKLC